MKLLLDTHVFLWLAEGTQLPMRLRFLLEVRQAEIWVSAASLWELSLKQEKKPFQMKGTLDELTERVLQGGDYFLDVTRRHAVHSITDMPETADPFDRMLLRQCDVEQMKLVTVDKLLVNHRLAWRDSV